MAIALIVFLSDVLPECVPSYIWMWIEDLCEDVSVNRGRNVNFLPSGDVTAITDRLERTGIVGCGS